MDKNTIIAIVLSTVVIVAGITIQAKYFPSEPASAKTTVAEEKPQVVAQTTNEAPSASSLVIATTDNSEDSEILKEENFVVETALVRVEFTNRGGDIVSYKLKDHKDSSDYIEMADFVTENNRAFSVLLGKSEGPVVNEVFNVKKISETEIGFFKNLIIRNADGSQSKFTLAKQYSFVPDDYMFEMKVIISGDGAFNGLPSGYTIKTSPQIGPKWSSVQDNYEYRRFYYLLNGKKKMLTLKPDQQKTISDPFSWAGVAGKYFTLIALPEVPIEGVTYSTEVNSDKLSYSQLFLTRQPVAGSHTVDTWRFYIGPRTDKGLSKYNLITGNIYKLSDTKMDQIVEGSSFLGPLEFVLKQLMVFFYKIVPNWGVSIILLTILMRLILFPLTKKSSQATHKMQELQPMIQEIQAKHKNNPQKMNEEMAKFYQTAGYNPLSGCLPMLIQFPLIFAMYGLFNNYFEFRGAMFIPGWIPDLSKGDSVFTLAKSISLFGLQLTDLRVLPVIYVISQLLFGKVTQTPGATQQNGTMKFMMYGMPLMFFFIFYNAPSGLLIYWTFSNILTLIQQVIINKSMQKAKDTGLKLVKK